MSKNSRSLPSPLEVEGNEEFKFQIGKITFNVRPTEDGVNVNEDVIRNADAFPNLFGGDYASITRHLGGITLRPGETLKLGRAVGELPNYPGRFFGVEVSDEHGRPDQQRQIWLAASSLSEAFRDDATVSREHAELQIIAPDHVQIQDLGSKNGVHLVA